MVRGDCGNTGAKRSIGQWRTGPRRSLGVRLCAGAADQGRVGNDETACGAAWGVAMAVKKQSSCRVVAVA